MSKKTFRKDENDNLNLLFLNRLKILFLELKTHIQRQEPLLKEFELKEILLTYLNVFLFSTFFQSKNDKIKTKEEISSLSNNIFKIWSKCDTRNYFSDKKTKIFIEKQLISFYLEYNYTLDEYNDGKSQFVTPEILGSIYELFIETDERNDSGIFYTPKIEAEVMCKLSLTQYLLNEFPKINKDILIQYFSNKYEIESKNDHIFSNDTKMKLIEKIFQCKIIDPSCGSGEFILTAGESIFRFIKKINKKNIILLKDYEIKLKIIKNCLFGLDVKSWSLIVTQQRLLLWLLNNTSLKNQMNIEIMNLPILDLNFFLTDCLLSSSLNQKNKNIWNLNSSLIREKLSKEIIELIELKNNLFLFSEKANVKVHEQIKLKKQKVIYKILNELILHKKMKFDITELNGIEDFFLEVFVEKSGFDIVIGNPPYINQIDIDSPFKNINNKENLTSQNYKQKIYASMANYWEKEYLKDGNSDYYVYFFYLGLHILNKNGTMSFLSSRSWLEVDFGVKLQKFLDRNSNLMYFIDNQKKKSFDAAINTVITIFGKKSDSANKSNGIAILVKSTFEKFCKTTEIPKINYFSTKKSFEDDIVVVKILEDKIRKINLSSLHKPEIITNILKNNNLVPLSEYFRIERGLTTGANDFFIVNQNIELENDYLVQIIKSSKKINKILFEENFDLLISFPKEIHNLTMKARNYIKIGENKHLKISRGSSKGDFITGYQNKPMLKAKKSWFSVSYNVGDLIFFKHVYKRLITVNNTKSYAINNVLYNLFFNNKMSKIDREVFCVLLNSSLIWIMVELIGQSNLGEGAIVLNTNAVKNVLIPRIENINKKNKSILKNIYSNLSSRIIGTYFEELGVDEAIILEDPKYINKFDFKYIKKDRLILDEIVFQKLLLYSEEEHLSIYKEFLMQIRARLLKRNAK